MKKLLSILLSILLFTNCSTEDQRKTLAYIESTPISPVEKITLLLTKNIPSTKEYRVIVLTFTDVSGNPHKLGTIFSEKVTTELVKRGNVKVLDRYIYGKILEEKNLTLTGGVQLNTIKKIGEYLKLDAIVVGIISSYTNGIELNCRMLEPNTGMIISAEETYIPLTTD